ncbi:proline-rich protein 5 isoform X1 [Dasypus novemcinctus]|uniref:proline-rich protein 5 isoform X1 n=1 Tax=Dasypus novemcinctus TaxID=9361 RepID=UPI00265FF7F6|nr:proline-rich protein 5 isoform X1 [Dasypus novemcinctus]
MRTLRRLKFMSSPSLSDLGKREAAAADERGTQQRRACANATWNSIHNGVIAVFQRKGLPDQELFSLNEGVRQLLKTELGSFFTEYLQNQLLTKGMVILRDKIRFYEGQKLLDSLAETWDFFFSDVLPMLQAIFYPVQGKEPSVRQLALLHFRNTITLSVKLEDALARAHARVPPAIVQMLLVLQQPEGEPTTLQGALGPLVDVSFALGVSSGQGSQPEAILPAPSTGRAGGAGCSGQRPWPSLVVRPRSPRSAGATRHSLPGHRALGPPPPPGHRPFPGGLVISQDRGGCWAWRAATEGVGAGGARVAGRDGGLPAAGDTRPEGGVPLPGHLRPLLQRGALHTLLPPGEAPPAPRPRGGRPGQEPGGALQELQHAAAEPRGGAGGRGRGGRGRAQALGVGDDVLPRAAGLRRAAGRGALARQTARPRPGRRAGPGPRLPARPQPRGPAGPDPGVGRLRPRGHRH